jgi:hypothetical protein
MEVIARNLFFSLHSIWYLTVSFKKKKTSRKIAGGMAEAVEVKFARVKP